MAWAWNTVPSQEYLIRARLGRRAEIGRTAISFITS
jgi:hypothetical protein